MTIEEFRELKEAFEEVVSLHVTDNPDMDIHRLLVTDLMKWIEGKLEVKQKPVKKDWDFNREFNVIPLEAE